MRFRALAILLCSCLLAGSIPQISYAAEGTVEESSTAKGESGNEEPSKEEKPEEESEEKPEETENPPSETSKPEETETPSSESTAPEEPESPTSSSETEPGSTQTSEEEGRTEESTTEGSSTEESKTEGSGTEESKTEESGTEESKTEESSTEESKTEESSTEESKTEESKTEESKKEETTEEETTEEETEGTEEQKDTETTEEETTEEETLPEDTTELKYASAQEISLNAGKEQWFQFIAPESGHYNFYIGGSSAGGVGIAVSDARTDGKQLKTQTYRDSVRYAVMYLEKGQTVYPALSFTADGPAVGKTVVFGVSRVKLASVSAVEGGYTSSSGSFTASIGWRAASRTVSLDMTLSANEGKRLDGSYIWQIRYGNASVGYQYIEEQITPGVKMEKDISSLVAGEEYGFSMYLLDAETYALKAVIVPDGSAIRMQTGSSKEDIIYRSKSSGYDSITLDIEAVVPLSKYVYGALTQYEDEITVQKRISGISTISVSGLQPATTYYFEFYDSNGVVFGYTTVDTKEYPAKVNYSVRATGPDSVSLKADILSYTGRVPEYFNLCYEVADENGKMAASGMEKLAAKSSADGRWTIEAQASDLEHDTEYVVTMWINEPGYTVHFREKTENVKTQQAPFPEDALTVRVAQGSRSPSWADYAIKINGYTDKINGKLKYRMKNSLGEYGVKSLMVVNGAAKGVITGLQEGASYEYELRIAGVIKRGTFKMGDARINPELTDDTDSYDSVITYKAKASELARGGSYSVKLYYYNDETRLYAEIAGRLALSAENDYTVSVQAADYFALSPDTQYGFKWELYSGNTLADTQYQLVSTKQSKVTVDITANMADYVTYNVKIDGRTENLKRDITLFAYVCEEGGEYRKDGASFNLYASKSYKAEGRVLSSLYDERTYTVSFRDIKGREYGSYTFTFEAKIDGVRVSAGNQVAGAHNIAIQTQIEGEISPESYLVLFFKEKDEEDWDIRSVQLDGNRTECNFELTSYLGDDINSDTIYEYLAGISNEKFPPASATLEGTCSGEILTQTDGRGLTNVSAGSGYSYISIKAMLTNNPINTSSYIYVFYREKGQKDWQKSKKSFIISKTTGGILTFINELRPGTEYEYRVAVSDMGYGVTLNDIEEDRQVSGSIFTKSNDFALDISGEEDAFIVKADTDAQAKSLKAVLTLDDGQTKEVILQRSKDYSGRVSFDGLSVDKRYKVAKAELKVMETITGKCGYVTVASFEPQYEFAVNR